MDHDFSEIEWNLGEINNWSWAFCLSVHNSINVWWIFMKLVLPCSRTILVSSVEKWTPYHTPLKSYNWNKLIKQTKSNQIDETSVKPESYSYFINNIAFYFYYKKIYLHLLPHIRQYNCRGNIFNWCFLGCEFQLRHIDWFNNLNNFAWTRV